MFLMALCGRVGRKTPNLAGQLLPQTFFKVGGCFRDLTRDEPRACAAGDQGREQKPFFNAFEVLLDFWLSLEA